MMKARILGFMVVFAIVVATSACGGDGGLIGPPDGVGTDGDDDLICSVNPDLLFSNLPPEGIPALTEPAMVAAADPDAAYLFDFDRVLGVVIDGNARAYPHNILWHHEIINDRVGDTWFTVTFRPLTGSGLVLDPFVDGDRLELGVSGLLFANNLVLYDRISGDVYGPQLSVEGKCGVY
jgi:predicted small lipoprotein YifL